MKRPRSAPPELRTGAFLVCGLFSGVSPYGLLPPRSIQGIWNGRQLGYELGLRILNEWVSLLKVQALLMAITLEIEMLATVRCLTHRKVNPGLEADCGM